MKSSHSQFSQIQFNSNASSMGLSISLKVSNSIHIWLKLPFENINFFLTFESDKTKKNIDKYHENILVCIYYTFDKSTLCIWNELNVSIRIDLGVIETDIVQLYNCFMKINVKHFDNSILWTRLYLWWNSFCFICHIPLINLITNLPLSQVC